LFLQYFNYFLKVLKIGRNYGILYLQGSFCEGIPAILANLFLRKKTVIRIGGIFSWELSVAKNWTKDGTDNFLKNKQSFFPEILKKIDWFVISRCNQIIANSQYTKKLLLLNGIPAAKINVIYNSVDEINFEKIDKDEYKKKNGFDGKKIMLSVGRFFPWKNFDKLINLFEKINDTYILLIIGDGPEKEKIKSVILDRNLGKRVFIINKMNRDDLYKIYQITDLFALVSSFEGLSHTLIEAMRMNLPIIASNIEANLEVLAGYNKSVCININDEEFKSAVAYLENNKLNSNGINLDKFNFINTYNKTIDKLCKF